MNRMQKLQVILAVVRVKKFVYRDGQRAWFAKEKISMLLKEAFEKGLSRGEQAEALPLGSWGVSHEPQLCLGKALMGSRTICPAQLMPCAGTDTYIKSWKGEEETASTFQKALNKEGKKGTCWKGSLWMTIRPERGSTDAHCWFPSLSTREKCHPDQCPPSSAIITSIGPDSSGAQEDRLK